MGAQNPHRLTHYINQYEMMVEAANQGDASDFAQPFFYGSHYSTALGTVLYFLLRKEPFTQLHVCLQDGHFDHPDRLFYDVSLAIRSCLESMPEVKEVTPEWYSDESFLVNTNRQEFGRKQDHTEVNDVVLPRVQDHELTPAAFIAANRHALESGMTTVDLHAWMDLVFGVKQTGEQAVNSFNVFYPMTYFHNIDLTNVEDSSARKAIIMQAAHFGQCPQQAFSDPHPSNTMSEKTVPRSLREMLFACQRRLLTTTPARRWLGKQCRLHAISGYSMNAEKDQKNQKNQKNQQEIAGRGSDSYQHILGNFPSSPHDLQQGIATEDPLHAYRSSQEPLCWPTPTSYPWTIVIDCNQLVELAMIKILLEPTPTTVDYNIQHGCYAVEVFTEEGEWTSATILSELSARTVNGIQTMLVLQPVVTRYWRVRIVEIPFSLSLAGSTTIPVQQDDMGDDLNSIPVLMKTTHPGPCVKAIDVLGTPYFPRELPPGWSTLSPLSSKDICYQAVW